MRKQLYKIFSLIMVVMMLLGLTTVIPSQAAANDFSMKPLDKGYVTFIFDDARMPFTQQCFEYFEGYGMPMTCALVAKNIQNDQTAIDLFKRIEKAGGEIYSHTYDHVAITKDNSTLENIEKQLGDSYRILTGLGFNISGIIETGNGGYEKTANYELIETVSRKYYKYSNAYGVSAQYKFMSRTSLSGLSLNGAKALVDDAIDNKKWVKLWAHDFTEFSDSNMDELLKYIASKGKNNVEVVTSRYIYDTFGKYTGPQVPTAEAIASVCSTQGHNIKNGTVVTAATCDKGPVMKGKCELCGKTTTSQSSSGALGHNFENYVSDNNTTCIKTGTKTAKCSNKGCTATNTVDDTKAKVNHDFETVVLKEATDKDHGLAELKCSLCGKVDKQVVIPVGKDVDDVIKDPANDEKNEQEGASGIDPSQIGGGSDIPWGLIIASIAATVILLAGIGIALFFIIKKLKA